MPSDNTKESVYLWGNFADIYVRGEGVTEMKRVRLVQPLLKR